VCVADSFRESESQNKELSRTVQELTAVRMQLQSDRDAMEAEIQDSRDSIKDLQSRLDSANSIMNQLKVDLDSRVRERDEEIENLRSVSCTSSVTSRRVRKLEYYVIVTPQSTMEYTSIASVFHSRLWCY